MLFPSWNKSMTTSPYTSLYRGFLHICEFLGSIPSHHQPQYAEVPFWNNIKTPLPKHTILGKCTSLPYGLLKAETASMLAKKVG
jgi:hypothetical protein